MGRRKIGSWKDYTHLESWKAKFKDYKDRGYLDQWTQLTEEEVFVEIL